MKRGDIILCRQKGTYSGKPRPGVIVQSNDVSEHFESVTICPITSTSIDGVDSFRVLVKPGKMNMLKKDSYVMIDKLAAYPRDNLKVTGGKLTHTIMQKVNAALEDWLGL